MINFEEINKQAKENYVSYSGDEDKWHTEVEKVIFPFVTKYIDKYSNDSTTILNAGSGGEVYPHLGKMIHLDICENLINKFNDYIVASVDNIPLEDNSVDMIVCVGSVLNYVDASKTIQEFHRILKKNGTLLLEFERSDSADFKHKKEHHQDMCEATYEYKGQQHKLIMYGEKYIKSLLAKNNFKIDKKKRFHSLSTLLVSRGMDEDKASKYRKYDWLIKPISYSHAHNVILKLTLEK